MRTVMGRWKAWQARTLRISWQDNFFDHRIRNRHELGLKAEYIRQNPVVKGLCKNAADWPWVIDTVMLEQVVAGFHTGDKRRRCGNQRPPQLQFAR